MKGKRFVGIVTLLIVALILASGALSAMNGSGNNSAKGIERAVGILQSRSITSNSIVGIGYSEDTINIYLMNQEAGDGVPDEYMGYPIRKIVTGEIMALGLADIPPATETQQYQVHTDRIRPLVGGISVSSYNTLGVGPIRTPIDTAGTLGMITFDNRILSNAHVIAMSPLTKGFHKVGHPIVQPGQLDGGGIDDDKIGELEAYVAIAFSNRNKPNPTVNYVDAATATPRVSGIAGKQYDGASGFMISGVAQVEVGDVVEKSGRTTGVTTGTVVDTNARIWVGYSRYLGLSTQYARFEDVILVTSNASQPFSRPGDSGSAVHINGEFVGLNFAGSIDTQTGVAYSFICKAERIIDALGISVEGPLRLYAGGSNPGVVYRYLSGTTWATISPDFGYAVLSLVEYNGHLYAGTMSQRDAGTGQVYRYDGGTSWTLVGDNMDSQVASLAVYQGNLYAGTARQGMKLYRYNDDPLDWELVVNYTPWSGTRSLYVFNDYLLMGDWGVDYFGRWDGTSFYPDHQGGGSCIYDYSSYGGYVYAAAWNGRLWRSSDGIDWDLVLGYYEGGGHMWQLEVFESELYMAYQNRELRASSLPNPDRGRLIYTTPDAIISMTTDGSNLCFGTGGEAGYLRRTEGIANVYYYDGTTVFRISGVAEMGAGIQVLYTRG